VTARPRPRTGVCILRLEREAARLLISVRLNDDISKPSAERKLWFAEPEEALRLVHDFVEAFAGGASVPHGGG
jgi:hypothetical protein